LRGGNRLGRYLLVAFHRHKGPLARAVENVGAVAILLVCPAMTSV